MPSDTRGLLAAAARDNAEWCDAVCRAHGLPGVFGPDAWSAARRTPPLYPDAVTLTPEASGAALVAGIDTGSPGCSVKDGFAALDLVPAGFEVLFEAQWIHRPAPAAGVCGPGPEWSEVTTAGELEAWEAAWDGGGSTGLFRPALLGGDIAFLAGRAGGRIVAGAVAHRGSGPVVGVSNLFAHAAADPAPGPEARAGAAAHARADAAWSGVLASIAARWPGLPVVGYESGDDLEAAVRAGFTPIGPLRVWLHTA
ncbi:hypothetical protein AMK16_05075 [Streptomyces sp. CB00455]|nr:hypothetical protein [Streptomyces sp. CB00455]OKK23026.1 hypothetical protein AMK16_05075 [Streptomyces sp. CB00455]